jgi:hypothetical protein
MNVEADKQMGKTGMQSLIKHRNKIVLALDSGSPAGMTWRVSSGSCRRIAGSKSVVIHRITEEGFRDVSFFHFHLFAT